MGRRIASGVAGRLGRAKMFGCGDSCQSTLLLQFWAERGPPWAELMEAAGGTSLASCYPKWAAGWAELPIRPVSMRRHAHAVSGVTTEHIWDLLRP